MTSVAFSPDGGTLASASQDGTVSFGTQDAQPLASPSPGTGRRVGVAFSPDGGTLASASLDNSVDPLGRQNAQPIG